MNKFITILCVAMPGMAIAQPAPRHLEEVSYDWKNKAVLVYGGVQLEEKAFTEPKSFFIFKDGQWTSLEAIGPGARRAPAMVYDSKKRINYIIGGITKDSILNDVWTFDGKSFRLEDARVPIKNSHAAYDDNLDRMLVYGDAYEKNKEWVGGMPQQFELWSYNKNNWSKLSSNGPAPEGPYEITFDAHAKALIIITWRDRLTEIWRWQNEAWTKRTIEGPAPRSRYALTYNRSDRSLYMHGGMDSQKNFFTDFWKLNKDGWHKIDQSAAPGPAAGHNLIQTHNGILFYGGVTPKGLSNQMWLYKNGTWKKLF